MIWRAVVVEVGVAVIAGHIGDVDGGGRIGRQMLEKRKRERKKAIEAKAWRYSKGKRAVRKRKCCEYR